MDSQPHTYAHYISSPEGGSVDIFAPVAEYLQQVRTLIREELSAGKGPVSELLGYVIAHNGKMIRPGLVLLSGLACGRVNEQHVRVAALLELLHDATLLHDDVIDNGKQRRGRETVNSLKGNEAAVLLGDLLLCRVLSMCVRLGREAFEMIASAAAQTCEGELRQVLQRCSLSLTEQDYVEVIAAKSAALFSTACAVGALLGGAEKQRIDTMAEFGRSTGIAFQITDDILDLIGDERQTGKTKGSDLLADKLTLPLIHLLGKCDDSERRSILDAVGSKSADSRYCSILAEKMQCSGSIEYARRRAQEYSLRAVRCVDDLQDCEAGKALAETAKFAVTRTR